MSTLAFLHGAGTGSWIWSRVRDALDHPSIALDLPSREPGATPDRVVEHVADELDRRGVDSVILVLHSLSGVLASGLALRLGARLKGIVYVSAIVPAHGRSFISSLGFVNRLALRILFRLNPRGLKPSASMIRRELCNDLSDEDAELVVSSYEAEYPGLYLTPVSAPADVQRSVYVRLLQDRSVIPVQQDAVIARLQGVEVEEIDAGHLVMLSCPQEFASVIATLLEEMMA